MGRYRVTALADEQGWKLSIRDALDHQLGTTHTDTLGDAHSQVRHLLALTDPTPASFVVEIAPPPLVAR